MPIEPARPALSSGSYEPPHRPVSPDLAGEDASPSWGVWGAAVSMRPTNSTDSDDEVAITMRVPVITPAASPPSVTQKTVEQHWHASSRDSLNHHGLRIDASLPAR